MEKNKRTDRIIRWAGIVLIALVLLAIFFLLYALFNYNRVPDSRALQVMTPNYNIIEFIVGVLHRKCVII